MVAPKNVWHFRTQPSNAQLRPKHIFFSSHIFLKSPGCQTHSFTPKTKFSESQCGCINALHGFTWASWCHTENITTSLLPQKEGNALLANDGELRRQPMARKNCPECALMHPWGHTSVVDVLGGRLGQAAPRGIRLWKQRGVRCGRTEKRYSAWDVFRNMM